MPAANTNSVRPWRGFRLPFTELDFCFTFTVKEANFAVAARQAQ
jgi:hypothetical protein